MIKKELGDDYDYVRVDNEVVQGHGCITFYNTKEFKPEIDSGITTATKLKNNKLRGTEIKFRSLIDDSVLVNIANIHPQFSKNPKKLETDIKEFLTKDPNVISIVSGDFNCTVAPLNTSAMNITNNVAPSVFRNNEHQGAEAINGCFYSSKGQCNQADIYHLNPETGHAYQNDVLKPLDLDTLPDWQKAEMSRLRMTLCVDDLYTTEKFVKGEHTIYECEIYLKAAFKNDNFVVRRAVTLNNESGFGFIVPREVYFYLRWANVIPNLQFDKENISSSTYFVYTDSGNLTELLETLDSIAKSNLHVDFLKSHKVLLELEKKIDSMEKEHSEKMLHKKSDIENYKKLFIEQEKEVIRNNSKNSNTDSMIVENDDTHETSELLERGRQHSRHDCGWITVSSILRFFNCNQSQKESAKTGANKRADVTHQTYKHKRFN